MSKPDKADKVQAWVLVTGDASHDDDASLPGIYSVTVWLSRKLDLNSLDDKQASEISSAVLDCFHQHQGIEVLDDFSIEGRLSSGRLLEDAGSYPGGMGNIVAAGWNGGVAPLA